MFGGDAPGVRFTVSGRGARKRTFKVASQLIKLGSKSALVHVALPAADAEAIHASVRVAPDGRLWLVDTSGGGTKLNGAVIERAELFDGDTITVGETKVSVRVEDSEHRRDDEIAAVVEDVAAVAIPGLPTPAAPFSLSHPEGFAVELAPDCKRVHPGQHVEGTIMLPSAWRDDLEALELCCRWEATGDGGEEQLVSWACDELEGSLRGVPFAVTAPDGPLSYAGELIDVGWLVRATAMVAGTTHRVQVGFVLAPWNEEPIIRSAPGYRGAPRRWSADYKLGTRAQAPGLPLDEVGLRGGLLHSVWGGWLENAQGAVRRRHLSVDVTMSPTAHAGGPLAVRIDVRAIREVTISQVMCTLTAREFSREHDRAWSSADEHVVYEASKVVVDEHVSIDAEEGVTFESVLAVPTNAPPSFGADHSLIVWTVAVDIAIDHCPDWVSEQMVTIRPAHPV